MNKINFTNLPDQTTPINATNMNLLQTNVENAIDEVGKIGQYSTAETRIGTWVNNKPLYRKILTINAPELNSNIYHNIANISEIVDVKMILDEGSTGRYVRTLPTVYQENDILMPRFCISMYTFDAQKFLLAAGSYYVEQKARLKLTVFVEYTKTTD